MPDRRKNTLTGDAPPAPWWSNARRTRRTSARVPRVVTVTRPSGARRRARASRSSRLVFALFGGLIASVALWAAWGPSVGAPDNVATSALATVSTAATSQAQSTNGPLDDPPIPTPRVNAGRAPLSNAELAARISALLGDRTGRYSVVVELPGGEARYRSRADVPVEAASLYKLAIMVELYHEREEGWLNFDEMITLEARHFLEDTGEAFSIGETYTIELLLDQMITSSSNVAAAALLSRVGNLNINATMAQLGLEHTEIRWMPGAGLSAFPWPSLPEDGSIDELVYNVTSAADMGRLFRLLLDGQVVSPSASAEMLDLLAHQTINDRLPVRLPANTVVAHKTGNLPGLYHDVGVIETPSGPAVVAVLTEEAEEFEAVGFMAQLGEMVYYSVP